MTKDSYEVSSPQQGGPPRRRADNSFWLCSCTLLVVLLLCIIILLFSFRWCELGIFRKDEKNSAVMMERIQYVPESTRTKESMKLNERRNITTIPKIISTRNITTTPKPIPKKSTSNDPKKLYIPLTDEPSVTTTSKNYLNYLKSQTKPESDKTEAERNINKTTSTLETNTLNIIPVTKGSNAFTTQKAIIVSYMKNITTTKESLINSTKQTETEKIVENRTEINYATTTRIVTEMERQENIFTTTEEMTQDSHKTTTEDITSQNPMTSSKSDLKESNSKVMELFLKDQDVCNSTNCDSVAARIISTMDYSKQPCENFYDFACGGMLRNKKDKIDIFSPKLLDSEDNPEFMEKFNLFSHSCIKHEDRFNYRLRIKRARDLLHTIGTFHFDGQTNKTYNITEFIANLILFKAMPLFEVDIDIDPDNSTYILKLTMPDQTSLDFEHWSSLAESKRKCLREMNESAVGSPINMTLLYRSFRGCQMNYSDFLDSIDTAVLELGFFSHLTNEKIFKHIRDIRVFIEFEIFSLFEEIASPPNLQQMIVRRQYENVKLEKLQKDFPSIEWEKLFKMISNQNVTSQTIIQMYNRQYFEDVFRGISSLDKGMLNNAFLAILAYILFENTVLPSHKHSRIEYCNERSEELFPDIINYLQKKIISSDELNEHNAYVSELYDNLANNFNRSLENLDWLDDASKTSIRKKLDRIHLVLFRNDDVDSETAYLLDGYKDLVLKDSDYQYNFFNLMKFRRKKLFSLQGQEVTSENMYRYFVDATKEEPVFFYANDIVCIPYGLSRRATRDFPRYIIMAQVGFPLAKIIGHAFDSIGIQYRVQLSEIANASYINFADQTRDMIVLSNPIKFGNQEYFFSLNNALSESERLAENTALRLLTNTFNTFKNDPSLPWISYKFTKEKIFFLTMTQEFCRDMEFTEFMIEAYESHILPPQFRIENILGNSEEFLKEFNCRPGSAMTRFEDRLQFPYLTALSKEDLDYTN